MSDTVRLFCLRTVVYNNSSVGNGSVSRDELNARVVEKENDVGAGCICLVITLCKATEFFSKCGGPNLMHDGVLCKFFVLVDGFFGTWMDNWVGKMFKVGHVSWFSSFGEKIIVAWLC